jgi:hypothetical protein
MEADAASESKMSEQGVPITTLQFGEEGEKSSAILDDVLHAKL